MNNSEMPDHPGIYRIVCVPNGRCYIGSSKNMLGRIKAHAGALRRGNHSNKKLQRVWAKYGEDQFECEVLDVCDIEYLEHAEQYWIDHYKPELNNTLIVNWGNYIVAESTKEKLRILGKNTKGRTHSAETRERLSISRRKVKREPHSPETKQKLSDAAKRRSQTAEGKAHLSRLGKTRVGYSHSQETIDKMSNTMRKTWAKRLDDMSEEDRKEWASRMNSPNTTGSIQ